VVSVIFKEVSGDRPVEPSLEAGKREPTLLQAARLAGIPHYSVCGGEARCTTCRVLVLDGDTFLSPRTPEEKTIAKHRGWGPEVRLACQTHARGPATVRRLVIDDLDMMMTEAETGESGGSTGREVIAAVLFCDLANFTTFAHDHLPHDVVHLLNRYYREAGEAVLANGGYIDKYMGDGMMAIFGLDEAHGSVSPATLCRQAARAALMIADRVDDLSAYAEANWGWTLGLRIGIDIGPVVVGKLGHPEHRALTAIGDAVNTAERLQSAAKETGSVILVSGRVADYLGAEGVFKGDFDTGLKGYARPTRVFSLVDLKDDDAIRQLQSTFFRLMSRGDAFVGAFYDNLFAVAPQVEDLFESTDPAMQRRMLLNMLHAAVRGARHLEDLEEALADLGQRHLDYGTLAEHYPVAGAALEKALADTLGEAFTPAFRDAWRDLFGRIGAMMLAGTERGRESP
jgi:class 3 adenylate cyclase/hemoglobin-like flavoprotein